MLARVRRSLPSLAVRVVDIDDAVGDLPPGVFSVPTYTLDDVVISLGNPSDDFCNALRTRMHAVDRRQP